MNSRLSWFFVPAFSEGLIRPFLGQMSDIAKLDLADLAGLDKICDVFYGSTNIGGGRTCRYFVMRKSGTMIQLDSLREGTPSELCNRMIDEVKMKARGFTNKARFRACLFFKRWRDHATLDNILSPLDYHRLRQRKQQEEIVIDLTKEPTPKKRIWDFESSNRLTLPPMLTTKRQCPGIPHCITLPPSF
jgi:hypothetical protein